MKRPRWRMFRRTRGPGQAAPRLSSLRHRTAERGTGRSPRPPVEGFLVTSGWEGFLLKLAIQKGVTFFPSGHWGIGEACYIVRLTECEALH